MFCPQYKVLEQPPPPIKEAKHEKWQFEATMTSTHCSMNLAQLHQAPPTHHRLVLTFLWMHPKQKKTTRRHMMRFSSPSRYLHQATQPPK
jgi:hypothetical protein